MAIFEMSLEELRNYRGISAKPADFDEYWGRALKELEGCSLEYRLEPAGPKCFFAECFNLFFIGVGGARIRAKLIRPKGQTEPGPALAIFHGYASGTESFRAMLPYAAQGMTVALMDCRGQGGLSQDLTRTHGATHYGLVIRGLTDEDPDNLYFRQVYLDTVQLVRILMSMDGVDETRVGVTGGSQGGALTVACAALEPRIKLAAPLYPFLADFRRVYEMDLLFKGAYAEFNWYFRMMDPRHKTEELVFHRLGYIDIINLAPRVRARTHWILSMMDQVCPPSTQFAAYNRLRGEKEMTIYPEFAHEAPPESEDIIFSFLSGL